MFALGLGLYVAQSLCALCGLELVSGRAAGVSQGGVHWIDLFHGDSMACCIWVYIYTIYIYVYI